MNTVLTSAPAAQIKLHNSKPSFPGILRGEIFKITRQWTTWIMLVLLLGVIVLPYIVEPGDGRQGVSLCGFLLGCVGARSIALLLDNNRQIHAFVNRTTQVKVASLNRAHTYRG